MFKKSDTVIGEPELFSIFIFAGLPPEMVCNSLLHGLVFPLTEPAGVAVIVASGDDISVGVSVANTTGWVSDGLGGMDVVVGTSTCVSVTAIDGAVVVAFIAGIACALHALMIIASAMNNDKEMRLIFFYYLAIWIARILESYSVISYDYFPPLRCSVEGTKNFEVLFTAYKGSGAITSHGTRELGTEYVDPPAVSSFC